MIKYKHENIWFSILIPIDEIVGNYDLKEIVETVNFATYKNTQEIFSLSQIENFDPSKGRRSNVPTYLGIFNNCIYIKESNVLYGGNGIYNRQLKKLFPNYKLLTISVKYFNIWVRIFQENVVILNLKKREGEESARLAEDKNNLIQIEHEDNKFKCTDEKYESLIEKLLFDLTANKSIDNVKFTKFVRSDLNEILIDHKYSKPILKFFPNINKNEIYSAWVGGMERKTLPDEQKLIHYPNKSELRNIIGSTIVEALPQPFKLLKSGTLKWKTKDHLVEIYQGGNRGGDIELSLGIKFLKVEKLLKKIFKILAIDNPFTDRYKFYYLKNYFRGIINYDSYNSIANKLFWRLRIIEEELLPEINLMKGYQYLNQFINYDKERDRVLSVSFKYDDPQRQKPQYYNVIIALLAEDSNWKLILEREVLSFMEAKSDKQKVLNAFLEIKKEL